MSAESWFLFEEYAEAEAIYQKLLKWDPDNDNLKYKIGICLLNDPFRKKESITYLEEASKNINPNYKDGSFKERTAPTDALYYLGRAYLANERLNPAIVSFREFQKIMNPEVYDSELVREQITACENAKRLMGMPADIDLRSMGTTVNTRYSETNPVFSGNGERMAFITKQPFFDEALFIEKVNGEWTLPMSITSMLGFDMDIYPVAMNHEGTEMVLYYDDELIGNLYTSRFEDGF
jgi:tetratricopeptide (TPR) repeat protein